MSKEIPSINDLAHQFYRDHKKVLDLLAKPSPALGFDVAAQRLFGKKPERKQVLATVAGQFVYCRMEKNQVTFLPAAWKDKLDNMQSIWTGCENWWLGYPLITYLSTRSGKNGADGELHLNIELGPLSDHRLRKGIIVTLAAEASAKGLKRIGFSAGAADNGRLYSRFLQKSSVSLDDSYNEHEVEQKMRHLLVEFEPEFDFVANVIPQFPI